MLKTQASELIFIRKRQHWIKGTHNEKRKTQ